MFASKFVLVGVCAAMAVVIEGSTFLKAAPQHVADRVSAQDVQTSLLAEIEASLGTGIAAKRISEIKGVLHPMFQALPKNKHGNLEHVTVRYALHRVFVQRHGWSITGLDPAGDSWTSSAATGILKDQVPSYIQNLFEQRLGGRGLGLQELAVFAATIEHLVHNEAIGRLGAALNLHGSLPTALLTNAEADKVLDTYMMGYILGERLSNMTLKTANNLVKHMPEIFLAWNDTQAFVRKVREDLATSLRTPSNFETGHLVDFATLVRIAETVGEQFGTFQDAECKGLKAALTKIEDRGSGRVHLSDFYKPAQNGQDGGWQFQESIGYLRQLGTVDESNPEKPRIMIPNYLISQTNCIASSDYYSVCCINECEGLMVHLEKAIAAPEAQPGRILEVISALPSSSVSAPRTLSTTLRSRLEDMAAEHGGLVQLHGRLFSQWMHHAYPRECPFPHVAGTTSQLKPEEWDVDGKGDDTVATQEELFQFVSNSTIKKTEDVEDVHELMMWSHEEELLIVRKPEVPTASMGTASIFAGVRSVLLFAVLMSVVFGLLRTGFTSAGASEVPQKFMV